MVDTDRKIVRDVVATYYDYHLHKMDLKGFLAEILRVHEENDSRFQRMTIELQDEESYDSHTCRLVVHGERLESDGEYATRIETEADREKREESRLRQQYEALKKRFGI